MDLLLMREGIVYFNDLPPFFVSGCMWRSCIPIYKGTGRTGPQACDLSHLAAPGHVWMFMDVFLPLQHNQVAFCQRGRDKGMCSGSDQTDSYLCIPTAYLLTWPHWPVNKWMRIFSSGISLNQLKYFECYLHK